MQEIRQMYKRLRNQLLEKIDQHQRELLLLLQNVTLTSFNPFFNSPDQHHPFNKTSYAQRYLSITCVYCPSPSASSLIEFEENSSSSETIPKSTKPIVLYPFGYYKLKDSLTPHHVEFTVQTLYHDSETFTLQGTFEQSEDGYWIITFDNEHRLQTYKEELKLEFEGVLI
jgi:hypothetical protein